MNTIERTTYFMHPETKLVVEALPSEVHYYKGWINMTETIAAQSARIAELEKALNLGLYILTIPAICEINKRITFERPSQNPIADFEKAARALLRGE